MPPIQLEADVSLLVLPPLSLPIKRSSLRSAYKSTFESLLKKLARPDQQTVARLEIAVTLPAARIYKSRTASYPEDQLLFQEFYTLICLAAARTNTELDFPGGVDARVFLLTHPQSGEASRPGCDWLSGPIINLETLVSSSRPYKQVFGVEGEQGEFLMQSLLLEYRKLRKETPPTYRLPSGPSVNSISSSSSRTEQGQVNVHHNVINGGTFDHLHLGHKLLLTATVYLSDPSEQATSASSNAAKAYASRREITIGMTGDELLVNKKHPQHLESWELRQQRTHDFVNSVLAFSPPASTRIIPSSSSSADLPSTFTSRPAVLTIETKHINEPGPNGKIVRVTYTITDNSNRGSSQTQQESQVLIINYTQISDPYGPTITNQNLSAIIVSGETRAGGKSVNEKRAEKDWHTLQVFEVGVLDANVADYDDNSSNSEDQQDKEASQKEAQSFEGKISSTEIRRRLAELETTEKEDGKQGGKL